MTTVIDSRAVIQARIAERQRQFRKTDYGPVDFLFGSPISRADRAKWYQAAA